MEAIATYTNEEYGVEATITARPNGYYVALRDTDADQTVGVTIYPYTMANALDRAKTQAERSTNA